ncbi:MAG TPA: methyltransferase [Geminicoccaceae bacterium]|nr:methyltransferase [Geminicoccaceae bacterium]
MQPGVDQDSGSGAGTASLDALLGGRVAILQPADGYRVAIDTVLLAAAVPAVAGELVLDAGVGTGGASLCLAARVPGVRIVGLDNDPAALGLASASVERNSMSERIRLVLGDLASPPELASGGGFDQVMTNPPFLPRPHMTLPVVRSRAAARGEVVGLAAWIAACLALLRPLGRLTLVHRADRLDDVLAALHGRAGEVTLFPLWPKAEAPAARRVIVAARKGARGPARLARGLVLHAADGRFTAAADAVLRDGAPLTL